MARVYLALDRKHGREVAVKVLRPEIAAVVGRNRFLAEIGLTAKLDHPHILTLLDSGQVGDTLYYVLPYIRGESLRDRLQAEKQLPVGEAVRIACQVAGALDYAHRQGVIHRDIKPENILLHEGEAMLADFGIALAVQEAGGERLTESGLSLGTPQYMSPEQATGGHDLTARSDIFSLGAVTYEMLTGEPPFHGGTPQAVVARLMTERPPGIRTVRDTVPAALEAVVLQALAKVPADRFPTGAAFAAALGDAMTPTSEQTVAAPHARRWLALRWLLALAAATAVIVFIRSSRTPVEPDAVPAVGGPGPAVVLVSPFVARGDDTLATSIARSLSGDILDSLANVGTLRAVGTAGASPQATDSLLRGSEIALVVAGSVDRLGRELKATGRVSEGVTRVQLFSHAQRASANAGQVMEADLVERLVRFVRRYVGTEVRRRAIAAGTKDATARAEWSRAMSLIAVLGSQEASSVPTATSDRFAVADSLLGEAIRRDPGWIGPYVARGWAYLENASLHGSEGQRDSTRIAAHLKAIAAADAAIGIAPGDPDAHELRGAALVGLWFEAPSDKADSIGQDAERELRRAISLDLNVARAWEALSTYYLFVGRFDEARQAVAEALRADAFLLSEPQILGRRITADLNLERFAQAQQRCDEGARWYPLELDFKFCRVVILGWSAKDLKSAALAWRTGLQAADQASPAQRSDIHRTTLLMTAAILARGGHRDSAKSLLRTFEGTRHGLEDLDGFAGDEAYVRLLVGQEEDALALLKTFLRNNWSQRGYVQHTPWFRSLHGNPRFIALTERRP